MKGSYQFEKLEGRFVEANRLSERAQLRLETFIPLLRRHEIPETGRGLDVGCGQGIRTQMMTLSFPGLHITGIDRSEELLAQARRLSPGPDYQQADLYELPFPDETFDFVYARLVFMHLEDPLRALRCLQRVLKSGGRILLEDADRDAMFFEPAPCSFADFWKKVQDGQRRLGGDPNVGRKLAPYLKTLEFCGVRPEAQPIMGAGPEIEFLARTLMPSLNTYLAEEDRPQGEKAICDLEDLSKDPRATFYHLWHVVSGIKK